MSGKPVNLRKNGLQKSIETLLCELFQRPRDRRKLPDRVEPEFIGGEVDLRINIHRGQIDGTVDLNASNIAVKPPGNRR